MNSMLNYCKLIMYLVLLSLACPLNLCSAQNRHHENIKILIGSYNKSVTVTGRGVAIQPADTNGEPPAVLKVKVLTIQNLGNGITVNGTFFPGRKFYLVSSDNEFSINGARYAGRIMLYCEPDRDMLLINELDLEKYLEGLISLELSPRWELTAMKVQAVVARTYALYQKAKNNGSLYHLTSSVLHQLYRGIEHANAKTIQAVTETSGEVITYQGIPVMAVYHSCCGGKTEAARDVWGNDQPYLRGVICGACTLYDKYFWKLTVPLGTLEERLAESGYGTIGHIVSCSITRRGLDNRVQAVTIMGTDGRVLFQTNDFRALFGFSEMRSTSFIIQNSGDGYLKFLGAGFGHGVGLCQWGARAMAQKGETYKDILMHYYPGTKIEKYY